MQTKTKIALFSAALGLAFLWSGNARADYWTQHTRDSSGNVLPQYLELTTMARSSSGMKFLYGVNRIGGTGNDANWTRNLVSYDGTSWTDQTSTVESIAGYNDIEFFSMYADASGNVWMPNRKDPDVGLIKYGSDGSWTRYSSSWLGSATGLGGSLKAKNLFGNRNFSQLMYAVASADTRLYILVYDNSTGLWYDSGITGGPLAEPTSTGKDIWGLYSSADNSFWVYEYHSSEYEYNGQGDQGIGIWKYANVSWTSYNSSTTTSNGASFVNGITEAIAGANGDVWVGSRHGVFRHSSGSWENWTKDNSKIFTDRVQKVQEDEDGRIWIVSLAVETSTYPGNKGGISIYDPSSASWDYYTSKSGETALDNATNIFMIGSQAQEAWMFTGHGEEAMSAGIYALTRDDVHTAVYGQTSGTTVEKASLDPLKKSSAKKVTITKKWKVKKKWKKRVVYRGTATSGWYKKLNLDAGTNVKYIIKVGKRSRTVSASSGDPIRVNFN